MKSKIKLIAKKVIITFMIILTLFPALFSGFVLGADAPVMLTTERAGNYVSTFAINFFKNWSSINYVTVENSSGVVSTGGNQDVLSEAKEIFTNLVNYHHNVRHINYIESTVSPVKIATDISSINTIDCSSFTSAVLYKYFYDNQDKYGNTYSETLFSTGQYTGAMKANCESGAYVSYGLETYKNHNGVTQRWDGSKFVDDLSLEKGVDFLQPGDIVVYDGFEHQHTNVFIKKVNDNQYLAYDCGTYEYNVGWWNLSPNVEECLPDVNNMWQYNGAYVIRVPGGSSSSAGTSTTSGTKASTTSKVETYGEIKTEYDYTRDERSNPVDEQDETYKFSNKSFIDFAYRNALALGNEKYYPISNYSSSSNYYEEIGGNFLTNEGMIDITKMINSGKLLPGDILYTSHSLNGTQGDYLLYVGGSKVVYATEPYSDEGALRYENLQYYLARLKNSLTKNIKQTNPNASIDEIEKALPTYGIKNIYRMKNELLTEANVYENSENLFFNGKGYYDPNTKYNGTPTSTTYLGTSRVKANEVIDSFFDIFWVVVSALTIIERAIVVGWVAMADALIQTIVSQLSGSVSHAPIANEFTGIEPFSYSSEKISIESILFNGIPIIDANFFNFTSAGGHDITGLDENGEHTMIYVLRQNLATWYAIIRNFSIAIMLFMLVFIGIKMAIATTSEKKAEYKKMLINWLQGFAIVIFIHFFMYAVFVINDQFVKILHNLMQVIVNNLMNGEVDELSIYEAIRTKAYVFDVIEGMTGLILYIIIIYLLIRFLLIYFKRAIAVYILAMIGSFIGVKYAWEKANGKKRTSVGPWMKDFAFNVLLQSIHCLIYVLFMTVAFSTAMDSIAGLVISLIILRFMLDADKIFMKIFGVNTKGGLFDDVTKPGNYAALFAGASIMTIGGTKTFKGIYETITGKNNVGLTLKMARYADKDDDIKTAKQKIEMAKYQRIGDFANWLEDNFPGLLKMHQKSFILGLLSNPKRQELYRALARDNSYEVKAKIYGNIKKEKQLVRQRYTRPLRTTVNLTKGTLAILSAPALVVSGSSGWAAGIASVTKGRSMIEKELNSKEVKRYKRIHAKHMPIDVVGKMTIREKLALEDYEKQMKNIDAKDKALEKISVYEENINQAIERLKENTDPKETDKLVDEYKNTVSRTLKATVSSDKVKSAVSAYMVKHQLNKLDDSDLNAIIEELQEKLDEKKSNKLKVFTGDSAKDQAFVNRLKATFGGKSLDGLKEDEVAELIVSGINKPGVIKIKSLNNATGDMATELKIISDNMKFIKAIDEKTKVKTKENAVSFGKIRKNQLDKIMEVKK